MRYISEFRNQDLARRLAQRIERIASTIKRQVRLMEVCGTHAMSILKFGIKEIIPSNVKLVSGPGCPVCVTPESYIDLACLYMKEGFLIATFGDMVKVPGSNTSLAEEKSKGGKLSVVYSPVDALKLAKKLPEEKVVFLAIGFETTSPAVAATVLAAKEENVENFTILCGHKLIPPAMKALVENPEVKIDGFICPGHVSAIVGSRAYEFLAKDYNIPCVVAGFEPLDILQAINLLLSQISSQRAGVENEYRRVVTEEGNLRAKELMEMVFEKTDSEWRGMGEIKESGLCVSSDFSFFDAQCRFPLEVPSFRKDKKTGCLCGEVLQGLVEPEDCPLFKNYCTPSTPFGPCMVSVEGACNVHYRFGCKGEKVGAGN